MEYAMFYSKHGKILAHVRELNVLNTTDEIHIVKENAKNLNILLGTIKANKEGEVQPEVLKLINSDLAYVSGNNCHILKLRDIEVRSDIVIALVEGDVEIRNQSIATFRRVDELSVRDNILQRSLILAFEVHLDITKEINLQNWLGLALDRLAQLFQDEVDRSVERKTTYTASEMLEYVSMQEQLFSNDYFHFHLTHSYNPEKRITTFVSNINPIIMEVLVAYIQFNGDEVDESHSMDQEEIRSIIKTLYIDTQPNRNVNNLNPVPYEIDLYINWERFCGKADKVMAISLFYQERMKELLKYHIEKSVGKNK